MDSNERRHQRQQTGSAAGYVAQQQGQQQGQHQHQTPPQQHYAPQGHYASTGTGSSTASDRFRAQQMAVQSPTSVPAPGGATGRGAYGYAYGENTPFTNAGAGMSVPGAAMQYGGEYATDATAAAAAAAARSQQTQSYHTAAAQYGAAGIMYNVPTPTHPHSHAQTASPTSPYDSVQPYSQTPSQHRGASAAAIEVLSSQFHVPQGYYVPPGSGGSGSGSTGGDAGGAGGAGPYHQQSMSYTPQAQGVVGGSASTTNSYLLPTASSVQSAMGMHHSQDSSSQPAQGYGAVGVTSGSQGSTAAEVENAYSQYLQELRRTYEYVRDGRLAEAGTSLVQISDWLLGNAELLGLVRDEEGMHDERLKLWADFNRCWLVALQRQREMTIAMLDSGGQRPHPPESLMEAEQMETMGKELVRLCDMMEKHGLVDYQMGVWEEEIITFLGKCLDLLDEYSTQTSANGQATSSRRR